jgi:hypothetical protein
VGSRAELTRAVVVRPVDRAIRGVNGKDVDLVIVPVGTEVDPSLVIRTVGPHVGGHDDPRRRHEADTADIDMAPIYVGGVVSVYRLVPVVLVVSLARMAVMNRVTAGQSGGGSGGGQHQETGDTDGGAGAGQSSKKGSQLHG